MAESGIAKILEDFDDAFALFSSWSEEAESNGHLQSNAFCLSTANKNGDVSSRNLLLRRMEKDGFVIVTDRRSKKTKELLEHPQAAATFLWIYKKNDQCIQRQVRMEGLVHELLPEEIRAIYDQEPVYCKLRAHVCHQGKQSNWDDLHETCDRLYSEYLEGKTELSMPDHYVGFKITPHMMDFYHAYDSFFADRLCYLKEDGRWRHFRIAA